MKTNLAQKQNRLRISIRKEYREVNRLRRQQERLINFRLISLFSKFGRNASTAFVENGTQGFQVYSASILRDVEATLRPFYRECTETFAKRLFTQRVAQKQIEDYENIYRQFMLAIGVQRIAEISETTRRIIAKVVLDNIGEGVDFISRKIVERMSPQFTRKRATTIARTETHTASSFAIQTQALQMNEPRMKKRWIANTDGRTRESHAQASGQEVNISDDFLVGGKKMQYAGDPKGGASEVINCRCVIAYLEDEDEVFE